MATRSATGSETYEKRAKGGGSAPSTAQGSTEGTVDPSVVAWLVQRLSDDPRFLDKMYEQMGERGHGASNGLDSVLERLGDALGSTIPGPLPKPSPGGARPGTGGATAPSPVRQDVDPLRFREILAEELQYMRAIPPLTPGVLFDLLPDGVRRFLDALKQFSGTPFLRAAISNSLAAQRHDGRSALADPELIELTNRMTRDLVGGDREVRDPAAVSIGGFAGAAAAGAIVGSAAANARVTELWPQPWPAPLPIPPYQEWPPPWPTFPRPGQSWPPPWPPFPAPRPSWPPVPWVAPTPGMEPGLGMLGGFQAPSTEVLKRVYAQPDYQPVIQQFGATLLRELDRDPDATAAVRALLEHASAESQGQDGERNPWVIAGAAAAGFCVGVAFGIGVSYAYSKLK